jgi:hypothetical protein
MSLAARVRVWWKLKQILTVRPVASTRIDTRNNDSFTAKLIARRNTDLFYDRRLTLALYVRKCGVVK